MQRSHSLQSSLKRAGCRSSGKSVRFADWDGASLTRVRHLSADSVCQRNEQPSTSDEHDGNSQDIRVRLHSFSSNGLFIGGTVHVVNPRYEHDAREELCISVTTDNWRTFRNIRAFRHEGSTSDLLSQWHFNAHLTGLYRWTRCAFKVEYVYNGRLTVDDNGGRFYYVQIDAPKRHVDHSCESILSDLLGFDQLLIY
uniref:CBM21 domain-containing protein n=1 Tax=Ascaris lumbricoides TaxID=6252 RepID=A0A0M3HRQ1_ASCLU